MFDHVKFGVSDYAASKAFFLAALEPLGVAVVSEGSPSYGIELSPGGKVSLCIFQTDEKPAHLHLAFMAGNRRQVDAFHRGALAAGGKDNGAPGVRPRYHANYYAAFVIGPDGHNIEVVCQEPAARPFAPSGGQPTSHRVHKERFMSREVIYTADAPKPPAMYSQAVKAAGLVFVSGTPPLDPISGSIVGETIQEQTRQCLANISAVLEAAGSSLGRVVSATVIFADEADFAGLNEEWLKWFPSNPPARQGAKLPVRVPGLRVSIACVAEA